MKYDETASELSKFCTGGHQAVTWRLAACAEPAPRKFPFCTRGYAAVSLLLTAHPETEPHRFCLPLGHPAVTERLADLMKLLFQ